MKILISYDISDNKRRRNVAKILEGHGYRVQYSVFECELTAAQIKKLQARLRKWVNLRDEDSIRFYPLYGDSADKVQVIGVDYSRQLGAVTIV